MRVAFIDLQFSWPPHGGADVDVYHVTRGLQTLGHEVKLFGLRSGATWERGDFEPTGLPFPAQRIEAPYGIKIEGDVIAPILRAVTEWNPHAIHIGDSFFLKTPLLRAFNHLPTVARFYAYETLCQRDILRYRDGAPCPHDYLRTPDICRECGARHQRRAIESGPVLAWTEEYLASRAWLPRYWHDTLDALSTTTCIAYNEATATLLRPYAREAVVIPGGVDLSRFPPTPPPAAPPWGILMAGRAEDPVKGAAVLIDACRILARIRQDFHLYITMPETTPRETWFTPLPWCPQEELVKRYQAAAIAVVPSLWEEPFGMVALEAMACARPLIVSDVGGLRDTVEHGVSGLRCRPGDPATLAGLLGQLLDDAPWRASMGEAARARAEQCFDWNVVVAEHYEPLLQRVVRG